ncbi:hypothetical protein GGU11DRAFT_770367 [Lentinula aff. detonsa]|nr:hypothetical protein GGU11DRAFT_770367 [Lentinula aff. detonsa]
MTPTSTFSRKYAFPPFPPAPDSVEIVPFKFFEENGLKIQNDDYEGPEVDALDIPTVIIEKRHAGDYCKTSSKKTVTPQGSDPNGATTSDPPRQRTWLQEWENLSTMKSSERYNQYQNRTDRIHQATRAFNTGRPWPKTDKHIREQWDQFLIYIGILSIMPIWRTKQESKELEESNDVGDDFEDDEESFQDPLSGAAQDNKKVEMSAEHGERSAYHKKKPRPRPPYEYYDKPLAEVNGKDDIDQLIRESKDRKADNLNDFLDDPKESIQIYLSSYMMKQGFHYVDRNLTLLPRLIRFYIKFLLKDEVFNTEYESETLASLNEVLIILDLAELELPLTSQINKRLPWNDVFSGGCEELFEVKRKEHEMSALAWGERNTKSSDESEGRVNGVSSTAAATIASTPVPEEPRTLEVDTDAVSLTSEQDSDMLETPIQKFDSGTPPPVVVSAPEPRGSDESTALNILEPPDAAEPVAWDIDIDKTKAGGWGTIEHKDVDDDLWGGGERAIWEVPPAPTLFPILGPTALPLTHTSGIVEWSMRRIRSIVHPSDVSATVTSSKISNGPSAEAVEADLSSRLSKVVMGPWLNWDTAGPGEEDTSLPQIKGPSRGRVVVYEKGQGVMYEYDSDVRSNIFAAALGTNDIGSTGQAPAHDPLNHSITLLVEPESAKLMRVGMGLGATWVQIARQTDLRSEQEVIEIDTNGVEGKAVDMNAHTADASGTNDLDFFRSGERLWYMSHLLVVLPSYYILAS